MCNEYWRTIKFYNNLEFHEGYQISSLGRVRNSREEILEYTHTRGRGAIKYKCIEIEGVVLAIHRLVAFYFVPNPRPQLAIEVNHIDGNIHNNSFSNLEWVTRQENEEKLQELRTLLGGIKGKKKTHKRKA